MFHGDDREWCILAGIGVSSPALALARGYRLSILSRSARVG
jgi:hypothetical protein